MLTGIFGGGTAAGVGALIRCCSCVAPSELGTGADCFWSGTVGVVGETGETAVVLAVEASFSATGFGGRLKADGRGAGLVYTSKVISFWARWQELYYREEAFLPSGKRPVAPLVRCRPRYHPSPNSSSRSMRCTRSPFDKVNSSELLAEKSSVWRCISIEHGSSVSLTGEKGYRIPSRGQSSLSPRRRNINLRITIKVSPGLGFSLGCCGAVEAGVAILDQSPLP